MHPQLFIAQHVSLLPFNTFGLDVYTRCMVQYGSTDALKEYILKWKQPNEAMLHIGNGSNLLFLSNFEGCILRSEMSEIKVINETNTTVHIEVGAGLAWDTLVAYCVDKGFHGIENLSLIPGQVGAAAIQNIGAYGVEIADVMSHITAVQLQTGEIRNFRVEECAYAYRESIFKTELKGQFAITAVTLALSKKPVFTLDYHHLEADVLKRGKISLQNIRNTIIDIRQSKLPDPSLLGNAGSFFMNPVVSKMQFDALHLNYPNMPHYYQTNDKVKIPAGWLIEQAGWKGKTIGNAGVHDKQALVLVNRGGATGKDIKQLAESIQLSIYNQFGIRLKPEVNYI